MIVTFASRSTAEAAPRTSVLPQPVTVATRPAYSEAAAVGRQTGATWAEKVRGAASVRRAASCGLGRAAV